MRPSKYDYIVPTGEHTLFFNGVTEAFFNVPSERADTYETIINNPDDNRESFGAFIDRMLAQGFVVEDSIDELDRIKQKFEALTRPWEYYLMVLPTYQCNLRCWYCTQNHAELWMSDETLGRIKKMIANKLSVDETTHFRLSWFGGEPLLAYDKVLELTIFARDYCKEHGKTFSCGITSNATLLTPERIEALREAGVSGYQITIDGDRETHDSIKVLANRSAYDKTLANVDLIARHTQCTLRFNYTHENLKPESIINDLKEKLSEESLKKLRFFIYKVWQENKEDVDQREVDKLFKLGCEVGMHSGYSRFGLCYADQKHFDCVWPDGHVGKCDNQPPETTPGNIDDEGNVEWGDYEDRLRLNPFDNSQSECPDCPYLPVCWGPCVAKRENMLSHNLKTVCQFADRKIEMISGLINIRKTIMQVIDIDKNKK